MIGYDESAHQYSCHDTPGAGRQCAKRCALCYSFYMGLFPKSRANVGLSCERHQVLTLRGMLCGLCVSTISCEAHDVSISTGLIRRDLGWALSPYVERMRMGLRKKAINELRVLDYVVADALCSCTTDRARVYWGNHRTCNDLVFVNFTHKAEISRLLK